MCMNKPKANSKYNGKRLNGSTLENYLKDTYGMRCFKDRRFIWMIQNLMPDREKYIGLDSLDYDGTLMKIINNISSDQQKKIKIAMFLLGTI